MMDGKRKLSTWMISGEVAGRLQNLNAMYDSQQRRRLRAAHRLLCRNNGWLDTAHMHTLLDKGMRAAGTSVSKSGSSSNGETVLGWILKWGGSFSLDLELMMDNKALLADGASPSLPSFINRTRSLPSA